MVPAPNRVTTVTSSHIGTYSLTVHLLGYIHSENMFKYTHIPICRFLHTTGAYCNTVPSSPQRLERALQICPL